MIKKLLIIILGPLSLTANGQNNIFEWATSMGGTSLDAGLSIATDALGNVYTTGWFMDTVDFDPGVGTLSLISAGQQDIFIQKSDPNGNLLWAKSIGGSLFDIGFSITTDALGNVYTTGYFQDTVDFDPGVGTLNLISAGQQDIYIQKLDANGNFIWAKSMGGSSLDQGISITTDALGNVYTTGTFQDTVDFDPGVGALSLISAGADIYIQKLDANGNLIWAKSMGGTGDDYAKSVTTDALGNVYTTGWFRDNVDFDPGVGTLNLISAGMADIYIQKLDANGNLLWVQSMGGSGDDYGQSITTDALGNVYTTGYFDTIVDFDPGVGTLNLVSAGASDIYIQKLDANGNLLWAQSMGASSSDHGLSITTDTLGNVYTTGYFLDTVDFDPGLSTLNLVSAGGFDIFIQKLDANGNLIWVKSMGNTLSDVGTSITIDPSGNVYTTGYFRDTVDFDPGVGTLNLISAGNGDIFIQKLSQCFSSYSTDTQTACDSYTWIDGNTYTSSNSTATDTLTNAAGCDSVVTLNLTINTVNSSVTQNGTILSSNQSGASYQWVECPAMTPISGATSQSYIATANGDYAVIVNYNGCVDTSGCYTVLMVNIVKNDFGDGLLLYPNPTQGNFSIDLGENYNAVLVTIKDYNGKLVHSKTYSHSELLNLKLEEPAGVYLLIIESGDKKAVIRLIKE